jgi:hypothetical protein
MVVEEPTAAQLLEQWRAAERRRDALAPGTAEHRRAVAECEERATAYRDFVEARIQAARSELRPGS